MTAEIVHVAAVTPVLTGERVDLLKRTLGVDLSNDEFALFAEVCNRTGLDPFVRQIHAVKRGGRMTIQTGIDGYRLIADRTGKYAGSDDAEFEGTTRAGSKDVPALARTTVWKIVGGTRCSFTASARWSEYYPGDKAGQMWLKMPHVMLAKVSEALALRKAFPADLSGLYTSEEMDQAAGTIDLPPAEPMASKHDVDLLKSCIEELEPEQRSEFLAWKSTQDIGWPWTVAAYNAMESKLEEIVTAAAVDADGSPAPAAAVTSEPEVEASELATAGSPAPPSEYTDAETRPFE